MFGDPNNDIQIRDATFVCHDYFFMALPLPFAYWSLSIGGSSLKHGSL